MFSKMKLKLLVLGFLFLFQFSLIAAHLEGGKDEVIDGYLVDFGYSPENPSTKEATFISFNLLNDSSRETIDLTSVWMRISNSKEVVFSGEIKAENGNVFLNYKFPYGDDYEITSRFLNGEETVLETDFTIKIKEDKKYKIVLFLLVILVLSFLILKKYSKKLKKK